MAAPGIHMASVALLVLYLSWTPAEARQADPSADPPPRPEVESNRGIGGGGP